MMKRALSLLLCLVMVMSFAVPTVQANSTDDIYFSDGTDLDNVIVGDNVQLDNVVIDGSNVGTAPNPTELMSGSDEEVSSPMFAETEIPVPENTVCNCAECETIAEHKADCIVKAELNKVCGYSAEEIFAQWNDFTAEEQAYILQYMADNFSGRYEDLVALINAPTGTASETYVDGTTVSVEGIPQDGTLTVKEATDEVKEIVSGVVAQQEGEATELFTYDVSVQDGEGADWQPEAKVKMELELPGEKLHKYAKVYVVHVDDNGEATTIEAEVTEDGKIAFETPGFSIFAGFTVDFDYEGALFSIPGMSSIKLSELFENLKMPLNAEDVVNVEYTDYEQIQIEQLEGDWLLTSLKAFDTEEKLTLTMADGTEYAIRVRDAQFATTAYIYVGGTQADTDRNGECTWYLSGDSDELGYAYYGHNWATNYGGSYADGWSSSSTIEIRGPGAFQINLQHQQKSDSYNRAYWGGDSCALQLNLKQIKITNGAKLVFRLGSYFSGKEQYINICGTSDAPIFDIQDGSLYMCVTNTSGVTLPSGASTSYFGTGYSDGHVQVYLNGQNKATDYTSPLISVHRGTDAADRMNLVVEDVYFQKSPQRAVLVQTNNLSKLYFTNCTFSNTIYSNYAGGAICITGTTDGTANQVDVADFKLTNCWFNGNKSVKQQGGAIATFGMVDKCTISGCTFSGCTAGSRAGAIEFCVNGNASTNSAANDSKVLDQLSISNTTFKNCTAGSHGGAIDISEGDTALRCGPISMTNVTFESCTATNNRGGAIRMVTAKSPSMTLTNCTFKTCTSNSPGGAISIQSTVGAFSASGTSFTTCKATNDQGGAINIEGTVSSFTLTGGSSFTGCTTPNRGGGVRISGTCGDFKVNDTDFSSCTGGSHGGAIALQGTVGNFTIENGSTFDKCTATGARGGAISAKCSTFGNITLSSSSFTNCSSGTLGGAVHFGIPSSSAGPLTAGDVSVTDCTFSGNTSEGVGGCLSLTDGTYKSVLVQDCSFSDSYAANYGGAIGLKVYADDSAEKFPVKVTNNIQILDSTFKNCSAGGLSPEPYDHDNDPATADKTTWDHDGDPSTAEIIRLNGVGGGGAIALGAEVGGIVEIKSTGTTYDSTKPETYATKFTNCNTWNNGGAVCFTGVFKATQVDMKYVLIDGCRARDAGNAVHLSNCIIDKMNVNNCYFRNNSYFTQDFDIDIPGTTYDSLGKATYAAYDADGTFRCIGNTTCDAWIYNCTFINNESYSNGGAVYWNANNIRTGAGGTTITPKLELQGCNFDGNYAIRDGGAVYVEATVSVKGCWFQNNSVDGRGGAIAQQVYNNEARKLGEGEACNLTLDSNTSIWKNTATHGGGISITVAKTVSIDDGSTLLFPIKFTLGGAKIYDNFATQNGGGLYYSTETYENAQEQLEVDNYKKEIILNSGSIYNNTAGFYDTTDANAKPRGGNGGGVYMSSNQYTTGDTTGYSKVSISDAVIYSNKAVYGNGGGIYLTGKNALCIVTGGLIGAKKNTDKTNMQLPNTASYGTVYVDNADGTQTTAEAGGNGGGIAVFGGARIEMTGGDIIYNVAAQAGGGIAVHTGSTMHLSDGNVQYNIANFGGGISVNKCPGDATQTDITKKYGMYFEGGIVSYNVVVGKGTINIPTDDNTEETIIISNANGLAYGGGICLADSATMRFDADATNGSISYNNAVSDYADGKNYTFAASAEGGGIAVCQGSTMDIYGGIIEQNKSYEGGGVVVRGASTLNMRTSENDATKIGVIKDNVAVHYGGGIYGYGANVNIYDGQVITNEAKRGGGAYFANSSNVLIDGGKVDENEASGSAGGLFFSSATVTINGGSISKNVSDGKAGGICVDGACNITINGGSICDNKSTEGAGIWMQNEYGAPVVTIYGGTISRNIAGGSGGGIFVHGGTKTGTELNVYGGEISYNEAGQRGGGINADNWAVVKLSKYTAEDGTVTRPVVSYNTGRRGGGIFVCYGAELTVDEGFITFNHAKGTTTKPTGYLELDQLYGIGGGIGVGSGYSSTKPAKFTLSGTNMAIYGNLADYGADDVFANASNTILNIPQVSKMNLAGYKFKPEAWFEDYPIDDSAYESGLNLGGEEGIKNGNVYRYRGASSSNRIMIDEANVTSKVNAANSYVCMTLGIPAAVDDTVVIDYGLPVKIDVITNDVILNADELKSTGTIGATAPSVDNVEKIFEYNGIVYGGLDSNFTANNTTLNNLKHGVATLDRTHGYLKYQINSNDLSMDSEDSFYYAVYHEVPTSEGTAASGYYYYGKVTVIPATTIYFEDNFGNSVSFTGPWETKGGNYDLTDVDKYAQAQDRVGPSLDTALDADYVYGYDPLYKGLGYSLGSGKKITVSEGVSGTATFTFTGTGFDIISICNQNTGAVMASIYEGNKVDDTKLVKTLMVDTFYGCTTECVKVTFTFKDGVWTRVDTPIDQDEMGMSGVKPKNPKEGDTFVVYMANLVPKTTGNESLWQVPVIKADLEEYGTYTVELYVGWSWWIEEDRPDYEHSTFFLDAIRIYDPANNGVGNDTIQDAYLADRECWPTYQELRNMFITQEKLTDKPTSGAVFIDGFTSYTVTNYQNFGPNNEVYLAPGQTIAFKLDELKYNNGFTSGSFDASGESIVDAIHVGLKGLIAVSGKEQFSVKISNGTTTLDVSPSNTDRYYDITAMKNSVVTITNTCSYNVSITNFKVTHTADPGASASSQMLNLFQVNDEIAQTAIAILSGDHDVEQPTLTLKYPTLSFEGQIRCNVYFAAENLGNVTADKLGLAVFNTENVEGTVETADDVITGATIDGNLYMISTNGIAAKNLGDTLYFKVFAQLDDGSYVYSDLRSYSAVQYAESILASSDDSQKALVVAMLNYGAEAQKYFGYNTDVLMNSFLTADHQAMLNGYSVSTLDGVDVVDASKAAQFTSNGGFAKKYPTVSFEGAFQINYYFQPSNPVDGAMMFYYWTEDTYQSIDQLSAENADGFCTMELVNGEYTAVSGEIVAKDLDKTVYVAAVYECEGATYCTGVLAYSIADYCAEHSVNTNDSMYSFANAAAAYGSAAKEYFAA